MYFEHFGNNDSQTVLLWLHGWGVDHKTLLPLSSLFPNFEHYMVDFAGFGATKQPETDWNVLDYTNDVKNFIETNITKNKKIIIIGHSFGGRVAIKFASLYSDCINGIILIGGAGIEYIHSRTYKIVTGILYFVTKCIKKIFPKFENQTIFGSSDYKKSSGVMRKTFKNVINEELSNDAKKINLPTLLLYGENDTATPPYFGQKYNECIKNSTLYIIPRADHYSLLFELNKQTQYLINNFLKEIKCVQ